MSLEIEKRMKDKAGTIRRVVVACRDGKSTVVDDYELPVQDFYRFKVAEIWETIGIPTIPIKDEDFTKQLTMEVTPPGVTRMRLVLVPPDEEVFLNEEKRQTLLADSGPHKCAGSCPAGHVKVHNRSS